MSSNQKPARETPSERAFAWIVEDLNLVRLLLFLDVLRTRFLSAVTQRRRIAGRKGLPVAPRARRVLGLVIVFIAIAPSAFASEVTPRPEVQHGVTVRAEPTGEAERVGVLRPGESAMLVGSVPSWHKVRLHDGTLGFAPKRWTVVTSNDGGPSNLARVPFELHFLDVGTGDAAILDVGDREMVIDGGDSITVLDDYVFTTGLIQGSIELVVVTHADTDHWRGLNRLLDFDGQAHQAHGVDEFWEPGYDRDCRPLASYDTFIASVGDVATRFLRPLSVTHVPAVVSGAPASLTGPRLPGVRITVIHSDPTPDAADCAYKINNASIVLLVEVDGVRILFTGDANGKERDASGDAPPGHVEQKLLALEARHPGLLRADILKAPHHGSETGNTAAFIAAVDPRFVVISASAKHHLPKDSVVARYTAPHRNILRTDRSHQSGRDHIVCGRDEGADIACNYVETH